MGSAVTLAVPAIAEDVAGAARVYPLSRRGRIAATPLPATSNTPDASVR